MPTDEVAETKPALAWSGPSRPIESWKPPVPEIVTAVEEAYGNKEAVEVVAIKYPAVAELPSVLAPSTESLA